MPKFILTDSGYLRMGMVDMHKDLLQAGENCYGGGYYEFDFMTNRLLLRGKSYDYGKPRWDKLSFLKIPRVYEGLRLVYLSENREGDELNIADLLELEFV